MRSKRVVFHWQKANAQINSSFAPQPQDIIVTKRRVGAFSGSDLEVVLRSQASITSYSLVSRLVVLFSQLFARTANSDYKLTVLSDCCLDRDEEVHRVLTEKIFPSQADVMTAHDWLEKALTVAAK